MKKITTLNNFGLCVVLGMETRVLHILDKCSTTKLQSSLKVLLDTHPMPHSGFISTPWEPLAGALTVGYNCRVCATRTMLVSTHSTRMLNQETISPCSQKPQKKGASTCKLRGKDTSTLLHPLSRVAPTSCRYSF